MKVSVAAINGAVLFGALVAGLGVCGVQSVGRAAGATGSHPALAAVEAEVAEHPTEAKPLAKAMKLHLSAHHPGLAIAAFEYAQGGARQDATTSKLAIAAYLKAGKAPSALRVAEAQVQACAATKCSSAEARMRRTRVQVLKAWVGAGVGDVMASPSKARLLFRASARPVKMASL